MKLWNKHIRFNPSSFFGRLMIYNIIIIFISLLVIGVIFGYLIQNYYYGLKEWKATTNSRRIAHLVSKNISDDSLSKENLDKTGEEINTISRSSNMEIGIMNTEGKILLNTSNIKNFHLTLEKAEIREALRGNHVSRKIVGPENKYLLMIFPLVEKKENIGSIVIGSPNTDRSKIMGSIIIQTPLDSITDTINNIFKLVFYSSLIALTAAFLISITFARRVTKPLADINKAALKITNGVFTQVKTPDNSSEEIKHLAKTFNQAVKQIQENLQQKKRLEKMRKEFVDNISHEFRAPLTSIKGFLELMLEQNPVQNESKEYAQIMYEDTKYLEHLVSDLLTLGQLDSENISLHRENTTAIKIISKALNSLKNKYEEKNIQMNVEIAEETPDLYVDPDRIHRVMINLLENAIFYSPQKGKITIQVTTKNQQSIKFSIADQGPGIPENLTDKIWQRFYKVDNARTRKNNGGSGLGLSIVKNIIERHGGEIKVNKNYKDGANFIFILSDKSIK